MDKGDIPFLSASQLSELIEKREVSPVEAVEAYLERIEALNGKLFAYLTVCRDEALQAAREAEQALARGEHLGPMHGIPVSVKDHFPTAGIRTTLGSPIYNDFVPDEDATVVANLKSAGAIILGKVSLAEFATSAISHAFKVPLNPWDQERHPCGSSSGSGVATAAFMCAASLGGDTGGSVRAPASWCGLVGIRPTWGRVSRHGATRGLWSMDTFGPLTRTVEDCAMVLQAIAGYDPNDRYMSDLPAPDYRQALDGNIRGTRVGVVKELMSSEVLDPEVREAVSLSANVLAGLGASVEEISIPLAGDGGTISAALRVEASITHRELVRNRLREIHHDNRIGYLTLSIIPAQAYYKAQKLRALLRQQVLEALDKVDMLVSPTLGVAAQKIEPDPIIDSKEKAGRIPWFFTMPFSLANVPTVSVPCGFTSQNLPIGLQIAGRPFQDAVALKVAHAYEQATTWHTRRPPI